MADDHSLSAGQEGLSSPCNVYRIKHNPSWIKFGMHPEILTDTNARLSRLTSRGALSRGASRESSAVPSANTPFLSTALARQSASSSSLAAIGARAALRHEQHQQARATSRSTDSQPPAFHASAVHRDSHSSVSVSASATPRVRGDSDTEACAPESASLERSESMCGGSATGSTPVTTAFKGKGSFCDRESEMSCFPDDTHSAVFTNSSCRAGAARVPSLQPSVFSLPTASSSRAKNSHLIGSAALVGVAGPLDNLYVPLRRPAPRGCVATRQHFSLFEGTNCKGSPGMSAIETRAAPGVHREVHISRRGLVGGAPETDTYRTTNSAYGRGC
ncbi:hypothetical protein Q4I32_007353 [Leishmania shawi]|uniref:Uncharacterized protein n=1 Tax=Leishmania shawi TaxID=5680 RepID=A0AAW3B7J9_9TRYP